MKLISLQVQGDKDRTYTVDVNPAGTLRCTCPDHFYRQRECKHIKYARNAVSANRELANA